MSNHCTIYAEMHMIFDNDFDVYSITKRLGIAPTECKSRNETRMSPLANKPIEGFWTLRTEEKEEGDLGVDVTESLFDNGLQIIGITPFTKAGSIGFNHILNQQVSEIFGETTTLRSTLSATGGKVVPYAFAAYAWCKTTISIFSDDPVQRAEQRGYTLK